VPVPGDRPRHDPLAPTLGQLCRQVRQARGVTQAQVARLAGLPPSTVKRFEEGTLPRESTFDAYLAALAAPETAEPLKAQQVAFLRQAFAAARAARANEAAYLSVSFQEIRRRTCPAPLTQLVQKLACHPHPGLIRDELYFIHAFNGRLLEMLRMPPDDPALDQWETWHILATSFSPTSALGLSRVGDTFAQVLVSHFMRACLPMLFTVQMQCLLDRLTALAPGVFEAWWRAGATLLLAQPLYDLPRPIRLGDEVRSASVRPTDTVQVELWPGNRAVFTLIAWLPAGPEHPLPPGRVPAGQVAYAADHDRRRTLHVNDWPEVRTALHRGRVDVGRR
jgi:transcriptional regulator with XRE-family HTH domain